VNILLAKELNKLSFNNRERINEEIHGVCCLALEETPELLETALDKLSSALEDIPCTVQRSKDLCRARNFFQTITTAT